MQKLCKVGNHRLLFGVSALIPDIKRTTASRLTSKLKLSLTWFWTRRGMWTYSPRVIYGVLTFSRSKDMQKSEPNPQPQLSKRTTSVRIASTRSTNVGQSRLRSGGSVVIHDTDEEDDPTTQSKSDTTRIPQPVGQQRVAQPPPVTRTRKAKETQLRLGVGRPKVAGGAGARAVTKSFSVQKNNKRVSKSVKISEAVIPEEQDPGAFYVRVALALVLMPSHSAHPPTNPPATTSATPQPVAQVTPITQGPPQNLDKINECMQNIVRPPAT